MAVARFSSGGVVIRIPHSYFIDDVVFYYNWPYDRTSIPLLIIIIIIIIINTFV